MIKKIIITLCFICHLCPSDIIKLQNGGLRQNNILYDCEVMISINRDSVSIVSFLDNQNFIFYKVSTNFVDKLCNSNDLAKKSKVLSTIKLNSMSPIDSSGYFTLKNIMFENNQYIELDLNLENGDIAPSIIFESNEIFNILRNLKND